MRGHGQTDRSVQPDQRNSELTERHTDGLDDLDTPHTRTLAQLRDLLGRAA